YKANDGTADGNTATVSINVTPVNDAPVGSADAYTTAEDTPLTVSAGAGVLANDVDVDSSITAVLVSSVSHGTLTFAADGSFTYTPSANYNGSDLFTYKAFDGALFSGVVTVSITVSPVDDAPVAAADSYLTLEDTPLSVPAGFGLLTNDSDIDSPSLTAVLATAPAHGTVALAADGSFTYTPAPNFNGTDTFTYKANDGTALSAPATVSIYVTPVNDPPVAVDDAYTTTELTPLHVTAAEGVLANDIDVDSPVLTALLVSSPAHGALTIGSNGNFDYSPAAGFLGEDTFRYRAIDSSNSISAEAVVTITVVPVENPPTVPALASPADGTTIRPGELLRWSASTDPDGNAIRYDVEILRAGAVVDIVSTTSTELAFPESLGDGHFQWAVRAVDSTKQASAYSPAWAVVVESPHGEGFSCSTTVPSTQAPRGAGLLLTLGSLAIAAVRARRR
ncbi:MAG TPA: cadherin-like domain-containing protein, partial [bacterium]|nr:cadherin-like domain-containing protein [bacterium]